MTHTVKVRRCCTCREELAPARRNALCTSCQREYMKAWREAHPGYDTELARKRRTNPNVQMQQRDFSRRWRARNREWSRDQAREREARLRGARSSQPVNRLKIYECDGGKCHICRRQTDPKNFHLDHLIPVSKGGPHSPENLRVAHPRCNIRRYDGRIPAQLLMFG